MPTKGYVLDEALPTTIAEGRRFFEKHTRGGANLSARRQVPRPGDRFVNKDYATTLRAIAKDGADTFYRGEIARRIAADMAKNGGIITYADLAQYRAIEREPVVGQYRGHASLGAAAGLDRRSSCSSRCRSSRTISRGRARTTRRMPTTSTT